MTHGVEPSPALRRAAGADPHSRAGLREVHACA